MVRGYVEPTFGQRLIARVIDALITLIAAPVIRPVVHGRARAGVAIVLVAAYEIYFVSTRGRTPGKMAMGTQVFDASSGATPTFQQATVRWLTVIAVAIVAVPVSAVGWVAGLYTIVVLAPVLRPPLHRGLHDLAAGTVVSSLTRPAL